MANLQNLPAAVWLENEPSFTLAAPEKATHTIASQKKVFSYLSCCPNTWVQPPHGVFLLLFGSQGKTKNLQAASVKILTPTFLVHTTFHSQPLQSPAQQLWGCQEKSWEDSNYDDGVAEEEDNYNKAVNVVVTY